MAETLAFMLLDEHSKRVVKTSVSVLVSRGIHFIDSLDEIDDSAVKQTNRVILLEGFVKQPGNLSDLELYQALYGLEYIFMLADEMWQGALGQLGRCFKCDIADLDYAMVQAAVFGDSTAQDETAVSYFDLRTSAEQILHGGVKYAQEVMDLAKDALVLSDFAETYEKRLSENAAQYKRLVNENAMLKDEKKLLTDGYTQLLKEAKKENSVIRQYEQIFTKDVYSKVRLMDYVNKPFVLYLKEYEDFLGLDQLVETLFFAFEKQQEKSVKVLRLFDRSTSRRMLTAPQHYTKLFNDYTMADVFANDYVCKSGDYARILEKLLMNDMGLEVLILIDSKDFNDLVLSGVQVRINLCHSQVHAEAFELSSADTLVNIGRDDRNFWTEHDVSMYESEEERLLFLSSRPAVRNILEICQVFQESV